MIATSKRRTCAAIAIAILLLAVFMPRPDHPGIWLRSLFEWLHVPVFGLISLAILSLTPTSWRRSQRFGLALLGSVMLGVLTEAAQIPMQRDASWEDLIADATGAAGFLDFDIDSACDDIAGGKRPAFVVFFHEGSTVLVE